MNTHSKNNKTSPEVSPLTVLCQHIRAGPLEVQHASVKGPVMRVAKGYAGGRTREAVRTTQTGHDGWHLILRTGISFNCHLSYTPDVYQRTDVVHTDGCTGEGWAAFAVTVHVSRHAGTARALVHVPLLVGLIDCPLVQTRHPGVCRHAQPQTHEHGVFCTLQRSDSL